LNANPGQEKTAVPSVSILIADDHELVRKGIRTVLQARPGWEVVAEVTDGREAVKKVQQLKPNVAILDISMPLMNGLEAARQIAKIAPQTKVLILTMHDSDPMIQQILEAGARGYLLKSDASLDLVSAVEAVMRNKTFFTPKVGQIVLEGYLGKGSKTSDAANGNSGLRLTARQRQIVQLLAEGKTSKEVAVALDISVKTAETHRANIMRRLDCHSVTDLVHYAIRNGITEA
jgi:DNA-binding NarL/FixJ family response regulator